MDIQLTYRNQQAFYQGFSFSPIKGAKRYNHFVYKAYGSKNKLKGVFNTEHNKEVLDTNYIIAIRRKIITNGVPQTRLVATHLQTTRDSLVELSNISYENKKSLGPALGALRSLEGSVKVYKEAQHKLRDDLKLLLSSKQFVNPSRATSEDIELLIQKWQLMSDAIELAVCNLMTFNCVTVPPAEHEPVLTARIHVECLVAQMRKILQVKGMIIHLLYGWKGLRELHERQEMLN